MISRAAGRALACGLVLAVAVSVLYAPVRSFGFVLFDDPVYVTENPAVSGGLSPAGVRWAFTSVGAAGNWHPLTWLSHMLDVSLFGLEPGAHHAVSAGLHVAVAVLAFVFLRRVLQLGAPHLPSMAIDLAALMAAAAYALHPLRVESVAWVAERKDVLATALGLLSLLAWLRHGSTGSARAAWATGLALGLGLLAKPTLVSVPALMLLLDVWPLRRRGWAALLREKLPLLALAALAGLATVLAQRHGGALGGLEVLPVGARLANAAVALATYLRQTLWPIDLAVFYPLPLQRSMAAAAACLLLLAAVSLAAWLSVRRAPWVAMGWGWYLIAILPMAGLVQVGLQAHADRYTYLPHLGLAIVVARAMAPALQGRWRFPVMAVAVVVLALLATRTSSQLATWRDTRTLFRHAAAVTDRNYLAHHTLALDAELAGRHDEALAGYRRAVDAWGDYVPARAGLARLLARRGAHAEALRHAEHAARIAPDRPQAWNDLGTALERLGRTEDAIAAYRRAVALRPDLFEAHLNLGAALSRMGRFEEGRDAFARAVAVQPERADARYGLGVAAALSGRATIARAQLPVLERLDPALAARLRAVLDRSTASGSPGRP